MRTSLSFYVNSIYILILFCAITTNAKELIKFKNNIEIVMRILILRLQNLIIQNTFRYDRSFE